MEFENLLQQHIRSVERLIYFRVSNHEDAQDILQETFLSAFEKFDTLGNKDLFKPWLLKIARNKCNDYYRQKSKSFDMMEFIPDQIAVTSKNAIYERLEFFDILNSMNENDKQILNLYYFIGCSQSEIARLIGIPEGTVKSRLYYARSNFKKLYSHTTINKSKGVNTMKLPEKMPEYKIIKSNKEPFAVKWEELMGWLIVPKLNEKINWALYEFPERKRTEYVEMEVTGKAIVHGIEGVEIIAKEYNPIESNYLDSSAFAERKFVAQLTDTHCRFLAECHKQNGITKYYTFLDDEEFMPNWGYGEDNCGKEINISPKGTITHNDNEIIYKRDSQSVMDIVGRYTVTIANKEFDTICVMDIGSYEQGVVTEQFIDKRGKTVLWRRFNADDWKLSYYKEYWSNRLPDNERLLINGKTYVHWYDCISDYIS